MRRFSTLSVVRAAKQSFKSRSRPQESDNFEKHFYGSGSKEPEKKKIWDELNISKHEFFIRKYGNITPEERKKLDEKVARQRRLREERRKHELGEDYNKPKPRTVLNPLSEYIYGTHPVISALQSGKRDAFSTLYIFNPKEKAEQILDLAKKYGLKVVEKKSKGEMNMLSSNGVHNGVVLETKKLQIPLISSLGADFDGEAGTYALKTYVDYEKKVTVQKNIVRNVQPGNNKFPLGVFVDGVTDPMNLGSIVRSAFYLGVDFLVVPEFDSARLGPVAAKASAGALDLMPIYKADLPLQFLDNSRKNGWSIVTASAELSEQQLEDQKEKHKRQLSARTADPSELPLILNLTPTLLIFGSEGAGVRTNVKLRSDFLVGLSKGRNDDQLVDSLNVGVAAGLMIAKCVEQ
ncbi:hypothetical protein PUMCH_003058 [Australozyma saopauloensis]|uniref:rRNA methyltransferase 1, mitochondrial n=1 Tax=Australozyma saopauloensis TaxID=291208 RepID=A0AAX4HBM4_9ASCO|nr:hypothetical protein PUMCH_003058 [[Candida] saopauloensis]